MKRVQIVRKLTPFFSKEKFAAVLILLGIRMALSVTYPFIYKVFIDSVLFEGNMAAFKKVLFLMVIWLMGNAGVKYMLGRVRTDFLVDMQCGVKQRVIENTMRKTLSDYLQKSANEMKRVAEEDCNEIENFFIKDIFEFTLSILDVCGFIVMMAVIGPLLLLGCMGYFCISYFEAKMIKKGVSSNAARLRAALSSEDHVSFDEIKNLKEIKCLNCEEMIMDAFHKRAEGVISLITKEKIYQYVNKYLSAFNHDLITRFFVYILGGNLVIRGNLSISSFLVFLGFYESFVKDMRKLMDSNFHLHSKEKELENILEYLAPDDDKVYIGKYIGEGAGESISACSSQNIREGIDENIRKCVSESSSQYNKQCRIEWIWFDNVSFRYPGNRIDRYVFYGVCQEFRKGCTYLIQGKSGTGKSTLLKLLYQEFKQYEGRISINGNELSDYGSDESYYRRIAVASCDSRLFHTSIRENLLLADPEATEESLYMACANAQFATDIQAMPQGLDTLVGENGSSLSGGQRERLILSRLFLKHADLYILDEAMDEISITDEVRILEKLRCWNKDSIILVVSHRLMNYENARVVQM